MSSFVPEQIEQSSRFCKTCNRLTLHQKNERCPIVVATVLSLFTCCLFIPVWIYLKATDPWVCQTCGTEN
mgnify:FL=1